MKSPQDSTPFDAPSTIWERITFPGLAEAYRQGVEESRERTRFDISVASLTSTPEQAADLRRAALDLAKLGVKAVDVEGMARLWYTEPARTLLEIDALRHRIVARYAFIKPNDGDH